MKINKLFLPLCALLMLYACSSSDEDYIEYDENLEIRGVQAAIAPSSVVTRTETEKSNSGIGRTAFKANDAIIFTTIKRTNNPLPNFIYTDIGYTTSDGTKWNRTSSVPEKIYWSDAVSAHTFVGYSLPKKEGYSFVKNGSYQGKLSTIDFSAGNSALEAEDLLLCYNADTKAETGGVSAKVSFAHALSCVRVIVNIQDYSAKAVDTQVDVLQMKIDEQPTEFTWNELGDAVEVTGSTTSTLTLWPQGATGDGSKKTFTFLGLTVPHSGNVPFCFKVNYDPQNSTNVKDYKGEFDKVEFKSGVCTTLDITLNHQGEKISTGVSYSGWSYVATPDIGELRKKSTFMDMKDNEVVTIHSNSQATADDATWLYGPDDDIKDIYGHNGNTVEKAYVIKSAVQLLSFAKEVNNGYDFSDKYIRLDADITMQKTAKGDNYSWSGIGTGEVAFNGTFLGGDRYINRLKGNSLFVSLGSNAVVEQLHISTIGTINDGALVKTNNGIIAACKVVDEVSTTGGALVGTNNGTIYACYYTGTTGATSLVGTNNAPTKTVGCYVASDYQTFTKTDVDGLNANLDALYVQNTSLTQFEYVYSVGNYPTVKKK